MKKPCQCGGHRFDPWFGKIPHTLGQLRLCTTATDPDLWSPRATTTKIHAPWSLCSTREAIAIRNSPREQPLLSTTRESLYAAMKNPRSQKYIKKKKKKNFTKRKYYNRRRKWQSTPVFLSGKSHGQRSLVVYSPRGCKELNMT